MAGVVYVNQSGLWTAVNFSSILMYAKSGGFWILMASGGRKVYAKRAGSWRQAYPSETTSWTADYTPTVARSAAPSQTPELSADPAYRFSNITTASDEIRWDGNGLGGSGGERAEGRGFGFSEHVAGAGFGAINRLRVTFEQKYITAPTGPDVMRSATRFIDGSSESAQKTADELTGTFAVITHDFIVGSGGWNMTDDEAGAVYDNSAWVSVAGWHDTVGDKISSLKSVQVAINYDHN